MAPLPRGRSRGHLTAAPDADAEVESGLSGPPESLTAATRADTRAVAELRAHPEAGLIPDMPRASLTRLIADAAASPSPPT